MREIGVDTGGSNVQLAINPDDGKIQVIEMKQRYIGYGKYIRIRHANGF